MPEQPPPHHDQGPTESLQEGSARIELTPHQEQGRQFLISDLQRGYLDDASDIIATFSLPQEVVQDAVKAGLIAVLQRGYIARARKIIDTFSLPPEVVQSADVQDAAKAELIKRLEVGHIDVARTIIDTFSLPQEVVQDAAKAGLIKNLQGGRIDRARVVIDVFSLPTEVIQDAAVQDAAKAELIKRLEAGHIYVARTIIDTFSLPQEVVQDAAKEGLIASLQQGNFYPAHEIISAFSIPRDDRLRVALHYSGVREPDVMEHGTTQTTPTEHPDPYSQHARKFYDDDNVPLAVRRSNEVRDHVLYSVFDDKRDRAVDTAAFSARVTHRLSPQEYIAIAQAQPDALTLGEKGKPDADRLTTELEKLLRAEGGDAAIADLLRRGIDHFGADAMLQYMSRPDLSRHDALHFFSDVLQLHETSGLSPRQFSDRILVQVAQDGAGYNAGTAHHHFAVVAEALKTRLPEEILAAVMKYKNIEQLQILAADLGADPFGSWKNLKKLYEINQLLDRTEILEELNKGEIPPKLRAYIETLAFHPNISTAAVIQFWKAPAAFLDVDDAHTPEEVNRVKKPTNLLSLPFLGLRAEDLRDALVDGELDRAQVFPPMQLEYRFTEARKNLREEVRRALGSKKEGIAGVARDVRKLFHQIKHEVFGNNQEKLTAFLEEKEELSPREMEKLEELLNDEKIGLPFKGKTEVYRATLYPKSSPEGVVAGNDTASCMPFGSGKNNAYMFNPVYAQMVVERLNEEGKWRTAAQSVLSLDHETSTPTPELMKAYLKEGKHIKDLVKPGDLERLPVVTCDNIEIAKNEEGSRVRNLREMYQKFFTAYLAQHAGALRVNRTKVAVGTGYTPADIGFRKVENRYIPMAPAGYSDNVHATCLEIDTGLPAMEEGKRMEVAPLTTRDAVSVAVLEGKAYSGNDNLLENLHKMQNNLIGMEIANSHFGRPNLSAIYRDRNGSPRGYILAYEGKEGDQPFVYLDDLATDREGSEKVGGVLIKKFFEAYVDAYGKESKPYLPIFTNAREKTSFPLVGHAERFAQRYGLLARVVELGTHKRGGDLMHDVVIVIGKTEEELARQEEQMRAAFEAGGEGYDESEE